MDLFLNFGQDNEIITKTKRMRKPFIDDEADEDEEEDEEEEEENEEEEDENRRRVSSGGALTPTFALIFLTP